MYAVIFERPAVVDLLLKRGANVDAKDHNGDNALSWAMKSGGDQMFKLLSPISIREGKGITGQRTRIIEELSVDSDEKKPYR
jgi:ankyrin repeat protein